MLRILFIDLDHGPGIGAQIVGHLVNTLRISFRRQVRALLAGYLTGPAAYTLGRIV
jgi:hypothetical protein